MVKCKLLKLILRSEEAGTHHGHLSSRMARMMSLGKEASRLVNLQFSFPSSGIMAVSHHTWLRRNLESYSVGSLTFWGEVAGQVGYALERGLWPLIHKA